MLVVVARFLAGKTFWVIGFLIALIAAFGNGMEAYTKFSENYISRIITGIGYVEFIITGMGIAILLIISLYRSRGIKKMNDQGKFSKINGIISSMIFCATLLTIAFQSVSIYAHDAEHKLEVDCSHQYIESRFKSFGSKIIWSFDPFVTSRIHIAFSMENLKSHINASTTQEGSFYVIGSFKNTKGKEMPFQGEISYEVNRGEITIQDPSIIIFKESADYANSLKENHGANLKPKCFLLL